jgi:EAL and modified HD-GYP domain-containing signal transduction protein
MSGELSTGRGSKRGSRAGHEPGPGKVFANRSPILDLTKRIWAYALDFVEIVKTENGQQPRGPSDASVARFLDTSAPRTLTSDHMAFVKTDTQALGMISDRAAWKGKIVFDFDLSAPEGEDIVGLLRHLDREKVPFCLSNVALTEATRPLFFSNCFVKVDATDRKEADLEAIMSGLRDLPVRTIATSVNTREDFDLCSRLGFELFHGEFFRKPSVLTRSSISPNHALLLDLSARTAQDADIGTIEGIFKKNPDLTFGLLNLVRSAFFHVPKDVTSIRQAIVLLGYKNLQKWAALMLFTINHSDPSSDPLFENVLVRARTMELAAGKLRRKGLSDAAYMTGIFSLVPALFGVRMEEMVEKANFGEEIREALLEGTGRLGAILNIAEELERAAYEKCSMRTQEAGVGLVHFLSAQAAALAGCSVLTAPQNGDEADRETSHALLGQKSLPSSGAPGQEQSPKTSWFKKVQALFHHP